MSVGRLNFSSSSKLHCLRNRCRANDQKAPAALGPILTKYKPRLDGLAEPNLIRQKNALAQRRFERKHRRLDLVGIQVNAGVKKRH